MSPILRRVWHWIEKPIKALTFGFAIIHALTVLGVAFVPWDFTSSPTLRSYIAIGAMLGAVLSFFLTSNAWMGVAKAKRQRGRNWYLAAALFSYLIMVLGPLVVSQPNLAVRYRIVHDVRDLLIDMMSLFEFSILFGSLLTGYFAIGAICLSSPILARQRAGANRVDDH
jgi:uncharacterized membrane protein